MSSIYSLRAVSKRYGQRPVLTDVTLAVHAGEILGLVGPNGAGKTTLLRVFAGLLRATTGTIGRPAGKPEAIRYFGGERTLPPNVSARRWLEFWGHEARRPVDSRRLGVLSRGTRQRLGLEATLGHPTALLLLDEPWEGLDPDASRWLSEQLSTMRAEGTAIIVSSHRVHELAEVCDRCAFLVDGRLAPDVVMCRGEDSAAQRAERLFQAFDHARGGAR
jgi:ABC-2 type transport system ATP-binding protein